MTGFSSGSLLPTETEPVNVPALLVAVGGKVEIQDEKERVIYGGEAATRLVIPTGVLRPGRDYAFRVAGKEGLFATLDRAQERARAVLAKEAARTGDSDLERLLGRVDEELGVRGCLGEAEEERT